MIGAFFESFGFYTQNQLAETLFQKSAVSVVNSSVHNKRAFIQGIPGVSLATGAWNLGISIVEWRAATPCHVYEESRPGAMDVVMTQDKAERYIAYKIGKIVRAVLQILQICLIVDLLVTGGRAIKNIRCS